MASPNPTAVRATVVQQVVDALRAGVRDGRYAPGQRLVEGDLTRELGVSRGPLREALGRLHAEGIIEVEPFRSAVVRKLSRREVVDLFQVRAVLEGEAARLAATRIDVGDSRERLLAQLARLAEFKDRYDPVRYMEENTRFHDLIVDISGNKMLATLVHQLHTHTFRLQFRNLLDAASKDLSMAEHDDVATALLNGDGRAAERAMRRHVRRSQEDTLKMPDQAFGGGGAGDG